MVWKCVYRLYGPNVYVDKMKALVDSLLADGHYNLWVWPVVVLGGEFILLLFIGVMAAGCWSELRGGCFWEVVEINWGHFVSLLPRGWLFFGGVVKRGFTV